MGVQILEFLGGGTALCQRTLDENILETWYNNFVNFNRKLNFCSTGVLTYFWSRFEILIGGQFQSWLHFVAETWSKSWLDYCCIVETGQRKKHFEFSNKWEISQITYKLTHMISALHIARTNFVHPPSPTSTESRKLKLLVRSEHSSLENFECLVVINFQTKTVINWRNLTWNFLLRLKFQSKQTFRSKGRSKFWKIWVFFRKLL